MIYANGCAVGRPGGWLTGGSKRAPLQSREVRVGLEQAFGVTNSRIDIHQRSQLVRALAMVSEGEQS